MQERDLENFLFRHPYLIDAAFENVTPRLQKRQVVRGKSRADLVFELESGLCIVELKITRLTVNDVAQLLRYCESWKQTAKLCKRHYLIGKSPLNLGKFEAAIAASEFEIKPLFFGEHLQTQFILDAKTCRYRPLNYGERAKDIFELRF
ncbi:MAG: DUF91 domain-containing protein [Pyrinomonadaceae bacterium]|nr:DUF91 domain-containing protein [Pyrinomonadaceae bacterium]